MSSKPTATNIIHCPACQTQREQEPIPGEESVSCVVVCPACIAKCEQEGYVALICCNEEQDQNTRLIRHIPTGDGCLMRRDSFDAVFGRPAPAGNIVLTDPMVMMQLRSMAQQATQEDTPDGRQDPGE